MSLHHRRRRMASLATAATLALALPAVGGTFVAGPAQSADPAGDCAETFPVDELTAGDAVNGLTVVRGTTPTTFTGEVLGVLEDGVAPDVDMVMVELDMPEFERTGGIWQGMSGSPVYAADGRLIGAVAYGLAWGPSPIAGVTPFGDMDDYLAAPAAGRVPLDAADARTVADRAGIGSAQAARGFRELPMPMGVSGLTARRLAQLQAKRPRFLDRSTHVIGRAAAADAPEDTVVAGGNVAASAAYGDVSMAGVGTVTSVCEGRVAAFGHPMALLGRTTMGLHPADVVYVQPDPVAAPFKVANIAPPVGTVTDDRLTGLTGTLGATPESIGVTSRVTYRGRARTGTTSVSVPDFAAEATYYALVANQDRVVDGPSSGSEVLSWQITGTERGRPFTLARTDRWTSTDLSFEAPFEPAELVARLSSLDRVTIDTVVARASVTDRLARHGLAAVEQLRRGEWVRVTRRAPATGRAGGSIRLRVVLTGTAGRRVLPLKPIPLPRRSDGPVVLVAQGGDSMWGAGSGRTVAQIRASLAQQIRHDQVRVSVGTPDKVELGFPDEEYRTRSRRASFVRTRTIGPLAHVVGGLRILPVLIR